jgi:hypothetical protein
VRISRTARINDDTVGCRRSQWGKVCGPQVSAICDRRFGDVTPR